MGQPKDTLWIDFRYPTDYSRLKVDVLIQACSTSGLTHELKHVSIYGSIGLDIRWISKFTGQINILGVIEKRRWKRECCWSRSREQGAVGHTVLDEGSREGPKECV